MSESKINMSLDQIIEKNNKNKRGDNRLKRGRKSRGNIQRNRGGIKKLSSNISRRGRNLNNINYVSNQRGNKSINRINRRRYIRDFKTTRRRINIQNDNSNIKNRSFLKRKGRKIINTGTKKTDKNKTRLLIKNLNQTVVNSELKTIFEKIGPLKRCGIHWDNLGNSKGTADIEYYKAEDAERAIRDYNCAIINEVEMKVQYANNLTKSKVGFRKRLGKGRKN